MFFKVRDVVDIYGKALDEDPFGLFEIEKKEGIIIENYKITYTNIYR